jgi:hypothetical protein
MSRRLVAVLGIAVGVAGCAGYRITPHGRGVGYDVYRPEPYVLLTRTTTKTNEGVETVKLEGSIVWLPNYAVRYRVKTWNHFGRADFQFAFDEGWKLTSLSDKSDNTEIAKTLISAAKDLALAAAKDGPGTKQAEVPPSELLLFRVVYDETGVVTGISRLEPRSNPEVTAPPSVPGQGFEWPGVLGALSWLLGFGSDSY